MGQLSAVHLFSNVEIVAVIVELAVSTSFVFSEETLLNSFAFHFKSYYYCKSEFGAVQQCIDMSNGSYSNVCSNSL